MHEMVLIIFAPAYHQSGVAVQAVDHREEQAADRGGDLHLNKDLHHATEDTEYVAMSCRVSTASVDQFQYACITEDSLSSSLLQPWAVLVTKGSLPRW